TVALLSYLSLPLVIVAAAGAGAGAYLIRKTLLRAGVPQQRLVWGARAVAWTVAALAGLGVIALAVLFVRMVSYSNSISFDEPAVQAPLAKARITRVKGVTSEVFATVAEGVKLEDVVNLDLFAGFDPAMTREQAERRLGPPSGRW